MVGNLEPNGFHPVAPEHALQRIRFGEWNQLVPKSKPMLRRNMLCNRDSIVTRCDNRNSRNPCCAGTCSATKSVFPQLGKISQSKPMLRRNMLCNQIGYSQDCAIAQVETHVAPEHALQQITCRKFPTRSPVETHVAPEHALQPQPIGRKFREWLTRKGEGDQRRTLPVP